MEMKAVEAKADNWVANQVSRAHNTTESEQGVQALQEQISVLEEQLRETQLESNVNMREVRLDAVSA